MTNIFWRGYRRAAFIGLLALAATVALGLIHASGANATLLVVVSTALAVAVFIHNRLPPLFQFLIAVAALLSADGWNWNLYRQFPPYDEVAHAITTLAFTLIVSFYAYGPVLLTLRYYPWLLSMMIVTLGTALGAGWEIVEYFFVLPRNAMTVHDTLTDLILDGLGAGLAVPLTFLALRPRRNAKPSDEIQKNSSRKS